TMDTIIDQQVAMDEALIPHARRLRIGRSNFRLLSNISSKESTLQLATTNIHHHSIRFKMDNKKHIVNLESFREMLHICPILAGQAFVEPPFEEEILSFICFLGHDGAIRRLTDVNINKLRQPWRSCAAIINKCLTGKRSGYDSLRLNIKIQRRAMRCIILRSQRNSNAYKEYYAFATRATPPKPKASVQKTRSSSNTTITPPTAAAGPRLTTSEKGKQAAKASKAKSLSALSENSDGGDEGNDGDDDEGDDDDDDDEGNKDDDDDEQDDDDEKDDQEEGGDDEQASDEEEFIHLSLSTHVEEETRDEESFDPILKTPENTDDEGNGMESIFESTSQMDVQTLTSVAPLPMSTPTLTPSTISTITITQQAPIPPTTVLSTLLQYLPNFSSLFGFDHQLKTLEANFSEFMQTNQFARAVSFILGIVQRYMDHQMNKTVKVKEQVKVQVSKILPKIKQTVNEQLEAEVLTRSSNSSKTAYAVDADLFEMELKKILIEKMEGNKSIHRSNKKRNLYKDLVEAYKSDKIILDTYGDTVTLKRRHDDADKDEEPSAGSDRGSKRRREGKEPESATGPTFELMKGSCKSLVELELFLEEVYKAMTDQLDWVNPEGASSRKYTTSITKTKAADYRLIKWIEDLFYGFAVNQESARDVYSKRRIIAVTELKIVECDGTLTDVRTTLDDRLKGIRMKYLPQSIWRKSDKDRATAMIQAIDKRLKTRRIIRSLERFICGRPYEGDFRMLQRTI
nr:hypothetical protein [Tanacetum cinerariifolium]